jgi:hypothetical protein
MSLCQGNNDSSSFSRCVARQVLALSAMSACCSALVLVRAYRVATHPKPRKDASVHIMSGFDSNAVYSVPVLPPNPSSNGANGSSESPAATKSLLFDFLMGFRVGEEFIYR